MNSTFIDIIAKKACFIACLFSFIIFHSFTASAQEEWTFDDRSQKAYDLVLDLKTEEAIQLIPEPKTPQEYYVISLAEIVELLVTEDRDKFGDYEDHFQRLLEKKFRSSSTADYQFLMSEINLQWAFVYLKFGQDFDAGKHLRESYIIADNCRAKYPDYKAIRKTTGLLEILIGSVPEKYNWLLSLLGMEGSIEQGLIDLDTVRLSESPLAFEADLIYALAHGFVFQKPDIGFAALRNIEGEKSESRLSLFLAASLAIKNSQSEEALRLLNILAEKNEGLPLHYADYLTGEIYLHKAEYPKAIAAYRSFINSYKGENYVKDAYYKLGLCYLLNGNKNDALVLFKEAKKQGKDESEADKSAARNLSSKELPQLALLKVRYATDGGYYKEARQLLNTIKDKDLPAKRDQVEYYYRKARLEHKSGQKEAAKLFYKQTIEMAGDENWYFAPNSCLQLGYIFQEENKLQDAKNSFQHALTYKKHEYKNSIDSKSRSALARLKK